MTAYEELRARYQLEKGQWPDDLLLETLNALNEANHATLIAVEQLLDHLVGVCVVDDQAARIVQSFLNVADAANERAGRIAGLIEETKSKPSGVGVG